MENAYYQDFSVLKLSSVYNDKIESNDLESILIRNGIRCLAGNFYFVKNKRMDVNFFVKRLHRLINYRESSTQDLYDEHVTPSSRNLKKILFGSITIIPVSVSLA